MVAVIAFTFMLVALCLFGAAGKFEYGRMRIPLTVITSFFVMIGLLAFRVEIKKWLASHQRTYRICFLASIPVISFFLIELPYNKELFDISLFYIILNICIIVLLFLIVFFAAQRTRGSIIGFLALCFIVGLANHFVVSFKGAPVQPIDLFSLNTVAAVAQDYSYSINSQIAASYSLFAFAVLLVTFLEKTPFEKKGILKNILVAMICLVVFGAWFSITEIEDRFNIDISSWSPAHSYSSQGFLACSLSVIQGLEVRMPEGYSQQATSEILFTHRVETSKVASNKNTVPGISSDEKPSVVVVMNESFADLSLYQTIAENYEGPLYYNSISDCSQKGTAYASVQGGGTCNSEFEFLTGSTMGLISGGVYPFAAYDFDKVDSLVSFFGDYGYRTLAIHPQSKENWRRDIVYHQLGFDEFIHQHSFENQHRFRGHISDLETYKMILKKLEESNNPQFIFNITMQNHGGYVPSWLPEEMQISFPFNNEIDPELSEYLVSIGQSDEDLRYLIEGLEGLDKKVILCFFGDHQPGFIGRISEHEFGKRAPEFTLEEAQVRFAVPYMIWKNYDDEDARSASGEPKPFLEEKGEESSLNYLGVMLLEETGLPLSSRQLFLSHIRREMPAINVAGYMDKDYKWHRFGEENELNSVLQDYSYVQYQNLFDGI